MARRKKKTSDPTASTANPWGDYIEFGTADLKEALATIRPVMMRRPVRKDMKSFHFVATAGQEYVTISGCSLDIRLQLRVEPLVRNGSGTVMIDADALRVILDAWHEPRVRVHLGKAHESEVKLSWLGSEVLVLAYDHEAELNLTAESCESRSGYFFGAEALAEAIRKIKYAVDPESTRYALGGILFDLTAEDHPAELVATDGRRLAKVLLAMTRSNQPSPYTHPPIEGKGYTNGLPVVPGKAINVVEKLARNEGAGRVGVIVLQGAPEDLEKNEWGPGRVQFVTRNAVLTATEIVGRFPQYRDVFPAGDILAEAQIPDAHQIQAVLALATAATGSESRGVDVTMAGGCIMIEAKSNEKGKMRGSLIDIPMTGRCSYTLNALMFRQILDVLKHDPVTIAYYGPKDPIVLRSRGHWEAALMPLTSDRDVPIPAAPEEPGEVDPGSNPEDPDNAPSGNGWESVETSVEPDPQPESPAVVQTLPKPSKNGRRKKQ